MYIGNFVHCILLSKNYLFFCAKMKCHRTKDVEVLLETETNFPFDPVSSKRYMLAYAPIKK